MVFLYSFFDLWLEFFLQIAEDWQSAGRDWSPVDFKSFMGGLSGCPTPIGSESNSAGGLGLGKLLV